MQLNIHDSITAESIVISRKFAETLKLQTWALYEWDGADILGIIQEQQRIRDNRGVFGWLKVITEAYEKNNYSVNIQFVDDDIARIDVGKGLQILNIIVNEQGFHIFVDVEDDYAD